MNFKELSLTDIVGVKCWEDGTCLGVSAFQLDDGSPFTTLGPVSLVNDARDALKKNHTYTSNFVQENDHQLYLSIVENK